MAGAGAVLMASSPGRPAQPRVQCPEWTEQVYREQMADLVTSQRNLPVAAGVRACSTAGGDGEEGVDEQGEGGPAVPGGPAAGLVRDQAGEFSAGLEVLLDRPPAAGHADQCGQRHRDRCAGTSTWPDER